MPSGLLTRLVTCSFSQQSHQLLTVRGRHATRTESHRSRRAYWQHG